MTDTRDELIAAGVRQLSRQFRGVTKENILTDYIFAALFISSLEETAEDNRLPHRYRETAESMISEVTESRSKTA